jgi:predicted DNA-binding transcriptional regulator YafY
VGDVVEKDADGWLRISVGFDVEEMAVEYALSFGTKLEVIEPRSLREKVIAAAKEVIEFYGRVAPI